MKYYITILFILIDMNISAQDFKLKSGDLIFQEACSANSFESSIRQVTSSIDGYQFTHVGIVYIDERGSVFVLEATPPEAVLTPLSQYLYPEESGKCYPRSVVGRLKVEFTSIIKEALKIGLTLVGKDYDYGFVLNNDKYYCSELIYEILKQANKGEEVFPLNSMTFKNSDSDSITKGWSEYFQQHNLIIPEGKPGINPGAMSRSDVIDIIHKFD